MKIRFTVVTGFVLLPTWVFAQGTFDVRFNQNSYTVAPGETFQVSSLINPLPVDGIFSFGVQLLFEPADARIASERDVIVPPPLDFNGPAGAGARRVIGPGSAGAKGSVDPAILPPKGYVGNLLVSFRVTDLSLAPGKSYQIRLGLFRTLGPTESVFVSGQGDQLDDRLGFGTAVVEVIPEPRIVSLAFACGLIGLWGRRGQWRHRLSAPAGTASECTSRGGA